MRTLIQGGWVVGHDGAGHVLHRDGVVVYDEDTVVHVGDGYDEPVDRRVDARGKLVSPGLVNCHIHARLNAQHALLTDETKTDYFGQNFLAYAAKLRGAGQAYQARTDVDARFAMWSAVRGGATTVVDVGAWGPMDEMVAMVDELGVRAYLGPVFRSGDYVFNPDGRIDVDWDEPRGFAGLDRAADFVRDHDGAAGGRVRGWLFPGQVETCTPELLTATKQVAADLGVGIQLHAAMNLVEFHTTLRERRLTPLQYLADLGFLGPEVTLGHAVFHARHSWSRYPYVDDLDLLAASGASVAHAPRKYAKMGMTLESFDEYRRRGVNVALGTDTYPEDLLEEMRLASLLCRVAEGSFRAGTPGDVYDAATLGGARALGRDDLGRLAPGAKADIIVVDLRRLHFGGVRDPIASLVEDATGQDVDTVVVDGQTLLADGVPTRVDEARLTEEVQESCERYWAAVPQLRGHAVDEIAPLSYPLSPARAPAAGGR